MSWKLWTILIAIILIAIEYAVLRCYEVHEDGKWQNIKLPVWVYILITACIAVPVLNLIAAVIIIFCVGGYVSDCYYSARFKDPKAPENQNNIMLQIIAFLGKTV